MLFSFIVGEVRVKGRVRVTMSIGTLDIFCFKIKEFQITTNKAVYTTNSVAGGWAGAVMSWAGAVLTWAGATGALTPMK